MSTAKIERQTCPVLATATITSAPMERRTARGRVLVVAPAVADLGAVGVEDAEIEIHARGAAATTLKACDVGDNLAIAGEMVTERWVNRRGVPGESSRLVVRDVRAFPAEDAP